MLKDLFCTYALLHWKLCCLQLTIACLQFFKLPADTSDADIARAKKEKEAWLAKIMDTALENIAFLTNNKAFL